MTKVYCFFSAGYLPYLGGLERYTYNLANKLTAMGNKVIIITSQIGDDPIHEKKEEAEIYRLPSLRVLNGRFPVVKYNKATRNIFKKLKEKSIDYIIVNTRFYLLSYVGTKFASKNHIPSIVIEHGTGHFTVNNRVLDFAGHLYEHFISLLVARNTKKFYGVSLECNKWLKHFSITAKGVLYNAIDEKQIADLCKKQNKEIEAKIKYNDDDIIITFTGRLIKEKGILKLLAMFKEVKKKYFNAKLCIAGDGELYNYILNQHCEGVYLLGKLSFDNVIGLLRITTIFCFPTDYPEGLPTSVLEAAACRNYVITTKFGGSKEVIIDKSYGVIMGKNDIKEIETKIIEAIEDKQMRVTAADKLYNRVINEFTWANTAHDLIKAFEE